jgi:hypothetical protein
VVRRTKNFGSGSQNQKLWQWFAEPKTLAVVRRIKNFGSGSQNQKLWQWFAESKTLAVVRRTLPIVFYK